MLRDIVLPLLVCLAVWLGFEVLEGQRDSARRERDSALFEVHGLREAARISAEKLAERDAIDLQRTTELNHELSEIQGLRSAVDAGRQRLRIKATCPVAVPASTRSSGLADASTAELAADARPDYFTLRSQLALSKQMILGLQDHALRVCPR